MPAASPRPAHPMPAASPRLARLMPAATPRQPAYLSLPRSPTRRSLTHFRSI